MSLIYVVIGGLAGRERELLILSKSRGRLITNLMRERLEETLGLKLCACRSRFETFAKHRLAAAHSCLAVPDTLHLSSCILPPLLNTVTVPSPDALPFAFGAPAISLGTRQPRHDTRRNQSNLLRRMPATDHSRLLRPIQYLSTADSCSSVFPNDIC